MNKRGQISTEYLIVVGFVTFLVISVLGVAFVYTSEIQDTIRFSQLESLANKITTSAESTFYSGQPSKLTITGYMPKGVTDILISGNEIVFTIQTNTGTNVVVYTSNVILEGTLSTLSGLQSITITAQTDKVIISN